MLEGVTGHRRTAFRSHPVGRYPGPSVEREEGQGRARPRVVNPKNGDVSAGQRHRGSIGGKSRDRRGGAASASTRRWSRRAELQPKCAGRRFSGSVGWPPSSRRTMWSRLGPSGWLCRNPNTMTRLGLMQFGTSHSDPGGHSSRTSSRHGLPCLPRFGSHSSSRCANGQSERFTWQGSRVVPQAG